MNNRKILNIQDATFSVPTIEIPILNKINYEVYEGDFAYGLRNGEGVFSFLDGSSFTGKFISDERYGKGVEVSSDGTRFEGYWLGNKREGISTFTNPLSDIQH